MRICTSMCRVMCGDIFGLTGLVIMMPGSFFINAILGLLWVLQKYQTLPAGSSDFSAFFPALFFSFSYVAHMDYIGAMSASANGSVQRGHTRLYLPR